MVIHSLCALERLPGKHWIIGAEQGEEKVGAGGLGVGVGAGILPIGKELLRRKKMSEDEKYLWVEVRSKLNTSQCYV